MTLPLRAAHAPTLLAKRSVSYLQLATQSWINRCHSSGRLPFVWTINPYRGCEFACRYCYARYTHEFLELRHPALFETRIFAKSFDARLVRRELALIPHAEAIAIGTATDPYQPLEARLQLTRQVLELLATERGRRFSLITKSNLIVRDAALLERIARSNHLSVHVTITTMDAALARKLEPRAPRPDLRIRAVEALNSRGVRTGVLASPVMPLLTDSRESLDAVAAAAAGAGASHFGGHALFLKPCSRAVFLPFLEEHFPALAPRYEARYASGAYLKGAYPRWLADRIEQARRKHRLARRPEEYLPEDALGDPQLPLFPVLDSPQAGITCKRNA